MGLIDDLAPGPVAIDTCGFIYFMERHPTYYAAVRELFEAFDDGAREGVTSAVTLLETLVGPLRHGDRRLADRYEAVLTNGRGMTLVPIDLKLLRAAAHLRAATGIKTPDALQLSAALRARCSAFVTNDRALPSLPGLDVVQLRTYANP